MNALTTHAERTASDLAGPGSARDPFWAPVVVRLATRGDSGALDVLGQLDSAPEPVSAGEAVIGELQGRVVAAVSLRDGRTVADPFVAAEEIVALVRLRAEQLAQKSWSQRPRGRARRG